MDIQKSIRKALAEKGNTRRWLAKETGYSPGTVTLWMTGGRNITVEGLKKVAKVFDMPVSDFIKLGE